jgi:NitT/TauT family transport system substrate-binding protein
MKWSLASKRLALAASAAAMALAVAACGGDPNASSGGGGGRQVTEMSFQTFPQTLVGVPVKVAAEQGFFERNGLDVTLSDATGGPAMIAAVAAGQVDAVGIPMFVGIQSRLAGAKIKALVGLVGGGGSVVFVSNRVPETDTPYPESARDLDGRTAAIAAPGGFSERVFQEFVEGAGASLKYQPIPGVAAQIAAMKAGKIDMTNFDIAASYSFAKQGVGRVFWDFQTTGPSELRGVSTSEAWVSEKFVEENPEAAEAFARSIAQADAWLKDPANRDQAGTYFDAVAGTQVADADLEPMIEAMKPAVGQTDVDAYARLLQDGVKAPPASELLAPKAPHDQAAVEQLAGAS